MPQRTTSLSPCGFQEGTKVFSLGSYKLSEEPVWAQWFIFLKRVLFLFICMCMFLYSQSVPHVCGCMESPEEDWVPGTELMRSQTSQHP